MNNQPSKRTLPTPLGLSRICPNDVVFDHYLDENERNQRLIAASNWVKDKLWLYEPLCVPQKWALNRLQGCVKRRDAIGAELAIVELISLEEPVGQGIDKHGKTLSVDSDQ